MTIIEFNNHRSKIWLIVVPMICALFAGAYFSISLYNSTVNLRHEISDSERNLRKLEVANAELKNKLYSLLDASNAAEAVGQLGLVLDKNPAYLELNKDWLATNFNQLPVQP